MYETTEVSAEILNQAFLDKIDGGMQKEAQEAATAYVRRQLHEDGILRRLWEPKGVTADELDPELDNDKPSMIVEIEPDAPSATYVPFKGTGDHRYFHGQRFRMPFGKIEADKQHKSKFELMTIRMNIMDWLKEHQVKAIHQQEDEHFIETINKICGDSAETQTLNITSDVSFKSAFTAGIKAMTSLRLPLDQVLMHKNTYTDSLELKVEEIGFSAQDRRFNKGLEGEDSFLGEKVVTTIKDDLVPENVMYFFAPEDYFCKFKMLQDATLFLKKEADMISFHTYEAPGFGIGNTRGVVKVVLG